ncbi:MAG: helix-turn-helix domain-containing protein [Chloroflexota bacterium]
MIRNEKEYQEAQRRLKEDQDFIAAQRRALEGLALSAEEIERAMEPARSFHAQLVEEVEWYERVRRRDFETIHSLKAIGRLLIAARIANGLTQQELAERLGVSQAQVSRDERNEYHGITVERAQLILDRLGEKVTARLDEKPLALAG